MPILPSQNKGSNMDAPGAKTLPIDRILEMRKAGLSNNQIVEGLQREGYTITQIFDALNQVDLMGSAPAGAETMEGTPDKPIEFRTQAMPAAPVYPAPQPEYQQPYIPPQQPAMAEEDLVEKIEEVTETIIEEKWKDFVETIEKIIEWKNNFTEKVNNIGKELEHLREEFDKLHTALLRKVEQYDKSMGNVGAQLKAMEMVFKDVLPKFTENVKQLESYTQRISKRKSD